MEENENRLDVNFAPIVENIKVQVNKETKTLSFSPDLKAFNIREEKTSPSSKIETSSSEESNTSTIDSSSTNFSELNSFSEAKAIAQAFDNASSSNEKKEVTKEVKEESSLSSVSKNEVTDDSNKESINEENIEENRDENKESTVTDSSDNFLKNSISNTTPYIEEEEYQSEDEVYTEEDFDESSIKVPDPNAQRIKEEELQRIVEEKQRIENERKYVEEHDPIEKQSFEEASNNGKKPWKLKKDAICYTLLSLLVLFFLVIGISGTNYKKKRQKEIVSKEEPLHNGDYHLNVGDYKSREYKPTKKEEEIANLKEVEDTFLDDKGKEEYKKESEEPTSSKPQTYYNSMNPTVKPSSVDEIAVQSDIRYKGEGFGYDSAPYAPLESTSYSQNRVNNPYTLNEDDIANRYIERAKQVNQGFNSNVPRQGYDEKRYSNAGMYDPSKASGDMKGISDNSLFPGTVISAVLVNGINTDYPGTITARVVSPVYDSKTGQTLLIPSGSILRGSYSSSSIGVKRIQISWQTLVISRDDTSYLVNLGSMVGQDESGYSGIGGSLNEHVFAHLKALGYSFLSTMLNHSIYSAIKGTRSELYKDLLGDTQDIASTLNNKMMDRALDIQPTVTVKPGTKINVDVDQVLTLVPFNRD